MSEDRAGLAPRHASSRPLAFVLVASCVSWPSLVHSEAPATTPPVLLKKVPAEYPAAQLAAGQEGTVMLRVTISELGAVTAADVLQSAGEAFDAAAIAAVRAYVFAAAQRGGVPVASRIRVPFAFRLPPDRVAPGTRTGTATAAAIPAPPPPSVVVGPAPAPAAPAPAPAAPAPAAPAPASEARIGARAEPRAIDVTVHGRARTRAHGISDFELPVQALAAVPRKNASELLELAPGILLTNEGGEGHAEQVFLRGFDAREGQDLEFTADGVPINDSGNLHGNGYADTHFIIPELVLALRVVEGPFAPQQGNYAVAGSADYELGSPRRGLWGKYTTGSFGTQRGLVAWGGASDHTFGAAEVYTTDGFGQSRAAQRGTAMGQYEGAAGEHGLFRVGFTAFGTHFQSAGVIREDDYERGKVGFYDTYDPNQGGDSTRFSVFGEYQVHLEATDFSQLVFAVERSMRLRENFTGFLLDVQEPLQVPHEQRGDLIDMHHQGVTFGARGSGRQHTQIFGLRQEFELGYYARVDRISDTQYRIQAANDAPYHLDTSLDSTLGDFGLYADANLRLFTFLGLRGGLRADMFTFDVLNSCAVQGGIDFPSRTNPPGDASCLDQQEHGAHREPVQGFSTASGALMPRATLLVGPFEAVTFSASYGQGVRSIDPAYVSQDYATAFAAVRAYEAGVSYAPSLQAGVPLDLRTFVGRAVFFQTHVDRDLVFNETEGRNTLSNGTTRTGGLAALRAAGGWLDTSFNVTLVRSTFDDTGLLVPYIPDLVVRSDTSAFHRLPLDLDGDSLQGVLGLGISYVGRRALPYGERSDAIFLTDASATLSWRNVELGISCANLMGLKYRLGEYNYVSDFRSAAEPTLVPARTFTAGAPRAIQFSLAIGLGGA